MGVRLSSPLAWLRDALGSALTIALITLALLALAYQWL